MDPYLEDSTGWPDVHQRLITALSTDLNRLLPSQYLARIGERVYVAQSNRSIYPDAMVLKRSAPAVPKARGAGGTAVLEASDPPWILTVLPEEAREVFVEIFSVWGQHRLITVIEVLSPANKASGSEGRRLYLTKQREILSSQTHLIEIDLLRQGEHTIAPPVDYLIQQGYWDYLVSLHRGGQQERFEVWAISLRDRLPRIHVPLADADPDVVVDLQAVLDRCYDEGAYDRGLDYRQNPPIPLRREDAEWADALLRERGLRE
jgi:Uma2 family endonuclease